MGKFLILFLKLFSIFCYFFILGIAIPTFLYPHSIPKYLLYFFPSISVVLLIIPFIKRNNFIRFCLISVAGLTLGLWRYFSSIEVSPLYHITNFLNESREEKTIIIGTIIRDPDERERHTFIDIKPHEVQLDPTNPYEIIKLKGKTGYIRAKVYPTIGLYYYKMSYGDKIKINSNIMLPFTRTNPAGYDYRKYLRARNVYAFTSISTSHEIEYLGVGEAHPFVKIAFMLRKRLLSTIRKTMPYPESAFLGAVTLGLRGGLPQRIREQFQSTGIAHVLALSGLHVGFIAILFYTISSLLRLPDIPRFIVVSFSLLLFTLLTGATPATQRAALMYSLWLFFRDVLKIKLWTASGRLTIPISAFIILFLNPLWLPDPSFSLSFMAVWSLIYITPVLEKILIYTKNKFIHNFISFPLFIVLVGMTSISFIGGMAKEVYLIKYFFRFFEKVGPLSTYFPEFFGIKQSQFIFLTFTLWLCGVIIALVYYTNMRWEVTKSIVDEMRYNPFLRACLTFMCAQIAIQLGMMWPLSSVYFYRFPIAGFYANFFAIPLIGAIVQLGWIAGLIDLFFSSLGLKSIAETISLVINAGNWNLCQAFLGIAKTWGELAPYPFVEMYSLKQLLLWYLLIFIFILHYRIYLFVKEIYLKHKQKLIITAVFLICGVLFFHIYVNYLAKKDLKICFLDVRLGQCVLVSTPKGKSILIDTGPYDFFRTPDIGPTLSFYNIKRLDKLILTSLLPQSLGGSIYILENFYPKEVYLPPITKNFNANMTYLEFLDKTGQSKKLRSKILSKSFEIIYELLNKTKKVNFLEPHHIIHQENGLKIESLALPGKDTPLEKIFHFSVPIKITYKNTSLLIPSYIDSNIEIELVNFYGEKLKSQLILAANNAHPMANSQEFISYISPDLAVIQYGWSSFISIEEEKLNETIARYKDLNVKILNTKKTGAVMYSSNGEKYKIKTILQ